MRYFGHKYHLVGQPPVRHLPSHESQDFLLQNRLSFLRHCNQEGALAPFRMLDADNGSLANLGVTCRKVLELDGRDPFPSGFDDVLGAISDVHITMLINGRDVASVEEPVLIENVASVPEIGPSNSWSAHLQ